MTRGTRMSKFEMQDLPAEVAKVVDTMKIGEVSSPFKMINERGKTVCAIVKLPPVPPPPQKPRPHPETPWYGD